MIYNANWLFIDYVPNKNAPSRIYFSPFVPLRVIVEDLL